MTRTWPAIPLVALLAATALAYQPARDGERILDDWNVVREPLVLAPLAQGPLAWLHAPRPVTTAIFALEARLDDLSPRGLHATSLAVHLAAVLLAFLVARESLRRAGLADPDRPALAAAALFALHPLQTAAVAYVAQRGETLAAALFLAALLALLARDRARPVARTPLALAALSLHAAALAAKPVAATLPAAWLLHAAIFPPPGEEEAPAGRRVARRLPLAAALLALSGLAAWRALSAAQGSSHAGFAMPGHDAAGHLATQLRVVPELLRLALWPAGQCGDRVVPPSGSFLEPGVLGGGVLLLVLAAGAALAAARAASRRDDEGAVLRALSFGVLFFLLALAPSTLVPLLDPLAEHRAYLALLGPALAAAAAGAVAVRSLVPRRAALVGGALAVLVASGAAATTWRRSAVWATNLAFWTDAAACAPGKARVMLNLAISLSDAGRQRESLAALRRARALAGDGTISPDVLSTNLVTGFLEAGLVAEAREVAETELARARGAALPWAQLAAVEYAAGRDDACEGAARAALAGAPSPAGIPAQALALKWMGLSRLRRGDPVGALAPLQYASQALGEPEIDAALREAERRSGRR